MRNNPEGTKVSEQGWAGGISGTGAKVTLWPVERTMLEKAVPLQPMGPTVEQISIQQSVEEQVDLA